VPVGAANVAPAARAVTVKKLRSEPPVGVGVAEDVVVVTSSTVFVVAIIVLFVKVLVLEIVGTATPPTRGALVLSMSVAQTFVTLFPVCP